jgi:hypothetical protein
MRRFAWLLSMLVPAVLGAQRVRGVVIDSALNSPVSGVVVSVLDSANRIGARTITDGQGRFSLAVPASAPKLRLMRIGYRLRDVTLGANRDDEIRFLMERVPPILERVQVSDKEVCPGSADRGAAFQLWDQARTGLLATVVAREAKPANAATVVYERLMSPSDEIVRKQTKRISRGRTTRPFVASNDAEVFARFGYMSEDSRGRTFHAPDADVLLHESFALTHCFRLRASDSDHRGQIGVAFAPAPIRGRDTVVDVSGVIWMDAASPQLRTLDFLYTALEPAAMAARAGGHIEFRTMPNGVAFIERWVLRLPALTIVETNLPGSTNITRSTARTPRADRADTRVAQIGESGGIVISAQWDDGTVWQDTPSSLAGVVKGRRTNTPISDAVVLLEGTDDSTTTDVNGEFDIPTIPGRYVLRAVDTALAAFVKPRAMSQNATITRGTTEILHLELPPVSEAIDDVCHGQRMRGGSTILIGHVASADGVSLSGVKVHSTWLGSVEQAGTRVNARQDAQEVDLDDEGRFVVCGVMRERPVVLSLFRDKNKLADTTVRIYSLAPTHRLLWAPRLSANVAPASVAPAAPEPIVDTTPLSPADRQSAFRAHVATKLGTYVTDSALAGMRGRPLVDVLPQLVKTLRVWRVDGQAFVVAPSRTTEIPGFQNTSRCISDVYVDGVRRYSFAQSGRIAPPNLAAYSTDAIAAVEFYAADTRVPDGLAASPCGVLLLWRK